MYSVEDTSISFYRILCNENNFYCRKIEMVVLKPLIIVMPQISFISGSQKGVNFFTERIWLTYTFQKAFRCLLGQIASTRPFIINKAARHCHLIEVYSFIKTLNDSNLKFLI